VRVIWTFPRQDDVSEFVPTRFKPLLNQSPNLTIHVGRTQEDPKSQRITKFKDSYIYFQEASVEPRQTPADMLANDEIDRSNPDFLDAFVGRLEDSPFKFHYRFSTPTIPGFGIDAIFKNESDQRYWMVKCPRCNHRQNLEWDKNLMHDQAGEPYYGCEKCHRDLGVEAIINGEYVAMYPGKPVHGYHVSGMMLPISKPPAYMVDRYKHSKIKNFYNLLLGETYETSGLRYDPETILSNVFDSAEEPYPHQPSSGGGTYMGVDQKGDLHVVIMQPVFSNALSKEVFRIIHAEVIPYNPDKDSWIRLGELMRHYNIRFCVHDAMPNEHNSKAFQQAFWGKVAIKYDSGERTEVISYNDNDGRLLLARTQNFDGLLDDIKSGLWRFWGTRAPLDPILAELVTQLSNLKRDEEERKRRDGSIETTGVWRKTGPDDFAHAMAYARAAYLVRPSNRMQVQLIGKAAEVEERETSVEYKPSTIWPGLMIPIEKKGPRLG
jgi:hypothetical protein